VGTANSSAYAASKGGVRLLTKAAAIEYSKACYDYGIRVNSVHPTFLETPMTAAMMNTANVEHMLKSTPLGRILTADEVAQLVLFLASDASSYCTGAEFLIDGGRMA